MDQYKSDIFSGIGVFVIQVIINSIVYAFDKNNTTLIMGIFFAIIISILISIILSLNKKIKEKCSDYDIKIKEYDSKKIHIRLNDLEQEQAIMEQQLELVDQQITILDNICHYYGIMDSINQKILYLLKNKKNCGVGELQVIIDQIEYIFRDDISSKNGIINSSIFVSEHLEQYSILVSTRHSLGTIQRLRLDNKSFVGAAFNQKKVMYCGDIGKRMPEIPFIDLNEDRSYQSILAIPCIIDEKVEFTLVITCNKKDCLEETYTKYRKVIQRYLELFGMLWYMIKKKEVK